jgi:hypothetical protein
MKTRKQGTQRKEEWGESSTQNEMRKERKQSEKKNRMRMLIILEELK